MCRQTQLCCWAEDGKEEEGSGRVSGGSVWCRPAFLGNKEWEAEEEEDEEE